MRACLGVFAAHLLHGVHPGQRKYAPSSLAHLSFRHLASRVLTFLVLKSLVARVSKVWKKLYVAWHHGLK